MRSRAPARTSSCWAVIIRPHPTKGWSTRAPSATQALMCAKAARAARQRHDLRKGTPMRFNPKADISGGRVGDAGGGGGGMGGGGMRIPIPGGTSAGGGIGGLIIIILFVVLTQCMGGGGGPAATAASTQGQARRARGHRRRTTSATPTARPAPTPTRTSTARARRWRCRSSSTGPTTLPEQGDTEFAAGPDHHLQRRACRPAAARPPRRSGPFYCPPDQQIYLDTTFFADVLEGQLGGQGGDFVEPYVLGHEYGHHIQNLLGTMGQVRTQQGPTPTPYASSCRPTATPACGPRDAERRATACIIDLDQGDIDEALDSAKAVGDDRIQQKSGQGVDPEGWTHGSSEQRMAWFTTGYERGHARGLRHLLGHRALTRCRASRALRRAAPRSGRPAAASRGCTARRWGGGTSRPSAPSPSATRASAQSSRGQRGVDGHDPRAGQHLVDRRRGRPAARRRTPRASGSKSSRVASDEVAEVGPDRAPAEVRPVDRDRAVAGAAGDVGRGRVAVLGHLREGVAAVEPERRGATTGGRRCRPSASGPGCASRRDARRRPSRLRSWSRASHGVRAEVDRGEAAEARGEPQAGGVGCSTRSWTSVMPSSSSSTPHDRRLAQPGRARPRRR